MELYDFSNQESPLKKFSNSTIEGGVKIENDVDYTVESSTLKSGNIEIKAKDKNDKVLINNSILDGDNILSNVSGLFFSEVNDSKLVLDKPTKISNQLFSFNEINDYEAFLEKQGKAFKKTEMDLGIITEEMDRL